MLRKNTRVNSVRSEFLHNIAYPWSFLGIAHRPDAELTVDKEKYIYSLLIFYMIFEKLLLCYQVTDISISILWALHFVHTNRPYSYIFSASFLQHMLGMCAPVVYSTCECACYWFVFSYLNYGRVRRTCVCSQIWACVNKHTTQASHGLDAVHCNTLLQILQCRVIILENAPISTKDPRFNGMMFIMWSAISSPFNFQSSSEFSRGVPSWTKQHECSHLRFE